MELKFPNARLFLHDLLANGRSTSGQAIVEAALEFGLIDGQTAEQLREEEQCQSCDCMPAARRVLEHYFARRNERQDSPKTSTDDVFAALDSDVRKYHQIRGSSDCLAPSEKEHKCVSFAPVLFDLLLQELRRYP